MTDAATSSVSNVNVISVPGILTFDIASGFNMQSMFDDLINQYTTSTYTILGIDIPLIGIDCLIYKTVDPTFDLKEAMTRLFNYLSKLILKPIFEILEALAKVLGAAIDDFLKIPILDLTISDLFKDDLWSVIEEKVKNLWANAQDELFKILETLGIPWPFFDQIDDPELSIRKIAKDIAINLWSFIFKAIMKIITAIEVAMKAYDIATFGFPKWSVIWREVIDAVLGAIVPYLITPPTIEDLLKQLTDLAKDIFDLPVVTFQELMAVIEKFELPVFGLPLDWKLPLNLKMEFPEKDFSKIISDMIVWINNFMIGILRKFIEAVSSVLEFFGVPINFLTEVKIPITLCVAENPAVTP